MWWSGVRIFGLVSDGQVSDGQVYDGEVSGGQVSGGLVVSTIQQQPGHTSTPMAQLKCHKKLRLWCLHPAPRQVSIICVSTWWDTVLKLQS